jgi:hypothetical protein
LKCEDYIEDKITFIELTVNGHKDSIHCDLEDPYFKITTDIPSSKKAGE